MFRKIEFIVVWLTLLMWPSPVRLHQCFTAFFDLLPKITPRYGTCDVIPHLRNLGL